jgi:hypothetical protein
MSMIEDILQQMQGAPTQQVAGQLGVNDNQASQAIAAALPMLSGALGKNAQGNGANALFGALGNHQQSLGGGGGMGDLLGAVLGGMGQQQPSGSAINGAGILGHIFGGQQDQAASQLGKATGMDSDRMQMLMQILAPIVMAYLSRKVFSPGVESSPQGVSQVLSQEQNSAGGGLLGSILGGADGKVDIGDIFRIGGSVLGGKR